MTFKKLFNENLMMNDPNCTFPMILFFKKCSHIWLHTFQCRDKFPQISKYILYWELLIYHSMDNCLRMWQSTRSQMDNKGDIEGVVKLLQTNIILLEKSLADSLSIEEPLKCFVERTSDEIRHYQFAEMKRIHRVNWGPAFCRFDATLKEQTLEFVREQRVMQLLKGAWVYTESHVFLLSQNKSKKQSSANYYFLILSPNRRALFFKEYQEIPAHKPTFDELDFRSILLSSIAHFRSPKIDSIGRAKDKASIKNLISIQDAMPYEEIRLINKQEQVLLSFYTDSEDLKAVWLDGLKMLKSLNGEEHLSSEISQHIKSLQEVRKNVQLLVLESSDFAKLVPTSSQLTDNEFYDLKELQEVAKDFHYK